MELYSSRVAELREELGEYSPASALKDHHRYMLGLSTEHMLELGYYDRKRIHNLKYFTWIEQQGRTVEELNQQWRDAAYWEALRGQVDEIDKLIREFNRMAGS
ncbi:MAG: pyridoxal-5-phosphate-dependent protein subunit beta, partial [Calditrichaeota bacterium]|nr:pyridoxal-5-phosphate-dependent protein subunit beta [Calditrichota bacterium]